MARAQHNAPNGNLSRVYTPDDEGPVNIIAVHGINTESPATWQAFRNRRDDKEGYVNWLADKDMLPYIVPSSPIWTFHYNTSWLSDGPLERLSNLADKLLLSLDNEFLQDEGPEIIQKRLVFIASSYGGVVVAQLQWTLERAKSAESRFLRILLATIGVVFLGSPLRSGPALTAVGQLGLMVKGLLGKTPSQQLRKDLESNTGILQQLLQDFSATVIAKKFRVQIRCFYELRKTRKTGFVDFIVNRDAACIDGHPQVGLDANHTMMNKFSGPDDKNFQLVFTEIRHLVKNHASIFDERATGSENDNDLQRRCHQAFKRSSYENHKNINPNRVQGTCLWALQNPKYLRWQQSQTDDLLWVSADPGCGKSVLSRFLIDDELRSTEKHIICYFFFRDNEEQNTVSAALCALLHQLFGAKPQLLHYAMNSWNLNGDELAQESNELWRIFRNAATDPITGNITCVLDALDECQETDREVLIGFLNDFYASSFRSTPRKSHLRFLVTSRPYDEIARRFRRIPDNLPTIRLPAEEKNDDISAEIDKVIQVRVSEISRELQLGKDAQAKLKEKLMSMTHRTYLWLHLVLEEVCSSLERTPEGISYVIDAIPESVDGAYEMLLNKNRNNDRMMQNARIILHIILAARRPLLLEELDIAFHIATEESASSFNELNLDGQHLEDKIRNLCGLFIFVNDKRVYLIHQTAKEFLVAKNSLSENEYNWKHSFEESCSEIIMIKACIRYLFLRDFDGDAVKCDPEDDMFLFDHLGSECDFMDYAASHWLSHFQTAKIDENDPLVRSSLMLCDLESRRGQFLWTYFYWYRDEGTALHSACLHHRTKIAKLLLNSGKVDVNLQAKGGRTVLHIAVGRSLQEMVELLLNNDEVNVNLKENRGHTALHVAVIVGQKEVIKLLLNSGKVDGSLKDGEGRTALQLAAQEGRRDLVKLFEFHLLFQ